MSRRISTLQDANLGIDRDADSKYDNIKIVADSIELISSVAESVNLSEANSKESENSARESALSAESYADLAAADSVKTAEDATAADSAANTALSYANYVGRWDDQSGVATVPMSVRHGDIVWMLDQDLANIAENEPGIGDGWFYVGSSSSETSNALQLGGQMPSFYLSNDNMEESDTRKFASQELIDKVEGVEDGATADQSAAEIKVAYESNSNTNNFTDTQVTKLENIEAGANNYTLPFSDNSGNWNSAYGWGNHALAGYKTTDTDTHRAIESVPVNNNTEVSISSHWANVHKNDATAHPRDARNQIAGDYAEDGHAHSYNDLDNLPTVSSDTTSTSTTNIANSNAVKLVHDIASGALQVVDVIDSLNSLESGKPLSANQGKVLNDAINTINALLASDDTTLDEMQELVDYVKVNKSSLENLSIANIAGLQTSLDGKVNNSRVLTDVPANALFTDTNTDTDTTYSAGSLLDLSGTTFNVDLSELPDGTGAITSADELVYLDNGVQKRKSFYEVGLSEFSNDSGFITASSDVVVSSPTKRGGFKHTFSNGVLNLITT